MSENEKIKQTIVERIRKIMETAGRTEAELLTAQNLCQKLMLRYNINKSELFVSDGDIGISEVENTYEGHETKYWTWDLLCRIGAPYNIEVIRTIKYNHEKMANDEIYRLIGSNEDREMVKSIFENILPVIRSSRKLRWKEYTKRTPKLHQMKPATFAKSYFNGYGVGLYDKLKAEREDFLRNMTDDDAPDSGMFNTDFNSNENSNENSTDSNTDTDTDTVKEKLPLDAAIENINGLIAGGNKQALISTAQQKWELIVARKKKLIEEFMEKEFEEPIKDANDRKSKKQYAGDAFQSGYGEEND